MGDDQEEYWNKKEKKRGVAFWVVLGIVLATASYVASR